MLACTNGDVRLVGGPIENEGTVEVCYNRLWGLVADSGWTAADSRVVCNQLGYTGGSMLLLLYLKSLIIVNSILQLLLLFMGQNMANQTRLFNSEMSHALGMSSILPNAQKQYYILLMVDKLLLVLL